MMSKQIAALFPPSSLDDVISRIASMDDAIFNQFCQKIEQGGLNSSRDRCRKISAQLNIPDEIIALLFSALNFIQGRLQTLNAENVSSTDAIREFVNELSTDEDETQHLRLFDRLNRIFSYSESIQLNRKIARLRSGFLENITSVGTFVDLRPDLIENNSVVRGFVPVVQLRISTDSPKSAAEASVFQMDEESLGVMIRALEDAKKKLETIKNLSAVRDSIYKTTDQ